MLEFIPHVLCRPGRRSLNEDSTYPMYVNGAHYHTFLVCDGVGGNNKGEVASQMVCGTLAKALHGNNPVDEEQIRMALSQAEDELARHSETCPECRGMATTLVGFHPVENNDALVFWVGDSRLYHMRKGDVLYKTRDHSLVQMMVDSGEIQESESASYPMRHIILQALDDSGKHADAEIERLSGLIADDIVLLMSDGILEGCAEDDLIAIFRDMSLKEAVDEVDRRCSEKSRDNFSLVALEVRSAE